MSTNTLPVGAGWTTTMLVNPPIDQNGHWQTGQWDITVTASSGLPPNPVYVHTAVARVTYAAGPDFTITVTPRAATVAAGQTAIYDLRVNAVNGFNSTVDVDFNMSALAGAAAVPNHLSALVPGAAYSFEVSTPPSIASGSFGLTGWREFLWR